MRPTIELDSDLQGVKFRRFIRREFNEHFNLIYAIKHIFCEETDEEFFIFLSSKISIRFRAPEYMSYYISGIYNILYMYDNIDIHVPLDQALGFDRYSDLTQMQAKGADLYIMSKSIKP